MFYILEATVEATSNPAIMEMCNSEDFKNLVGIFETIINVIRIAIPIILILYGSLDLGKAVMAGKEDEIKTHQKLLIKRIIFAVLVFLLATIVKIVFRVVGQSSGADSVLACFQQFGF